MISLISQHRETLTRLCRQYHVRRLELFGSAREEEDFDLEQSDLDFLVDFLPLNPGERADTYFGLLENLEALFQRPVDLVMSKAVKNKYFLEAVDKDRELLYAA